MTEPKQDFICPVCGIAVQLWRNEECPFHYYFKRNRVKHKTYKELVEAFLEEYPELKRETSDGQIVK